ATDLMWLLTPKISWITTTAPRGLPAGSATYAASLWPSAALSSIILPMVTISSMKKNAEALLQMARTALEKAGADSKMAEAAARHVVRAEEQGLATHGMSRIPFYCGMLRNGRADGRAEPSMAADRAAVCLIDNRDGLPYVSVEWALDEVIQRA